MRTLASKKKGKRNETLEIPETVNADDVRKMLGYETGPDPVDEDEINQFLADIGFPNDRCFLKGSLNSCTSKQGYIY